MDSKMVVAGTLNWNSLHFINYSCAPNCAFDEMLHGATMVIEICASKTIKVGAELKYNYSLCGGVRILYSCSSADRPSYLFVKFHGSNDAVIAVRLHLRK